MHFTKAHGTANDFVLLVDLEDRIELSATLVQALCDRRRGVGADGVLRLGKPSTGADVFMDYRNADGGIVEMCGNGVRVVAKHVVDHGLVAPDGDRVVVDTRAGHKPVTVTRDDAGRVREVTVDMGAPVLDPTAIPFHAARPGAPTESITVDGHTLQISAVSMGNPHAVTLVDDVDTAPVRTLGPLVEVDARFPKRTNVEFAQPVADDEIRLRVWERGVGETAACGTGACATLVAFQRLGRVGTQATVHVPGGILGVRYDPQEHPSVFLTGPAVEVAHGELDDDWLADARAGRIRREGPL